MIGLIGRDQVVALIESGAKPAVSLYMPAHRAGKEMREDRIRLKTLLSEAERRLSERGCTTRDIEAIRDQSRALLEEPLGEFHTDGLAVFLAPKETRRYRAPISFDELVVVNDRYHVTPLLPVVNRNGTFLVLALSQAHVRLLQGSQYGVGEVPLEGVPRNLAEALRYDDAQKQHQLHTAAPPMRGPGVNGGAVVHHGQGVGVDNAKTDIRRFLQLLEKGLRSVLKDRRSPMILAAAEPVLSIYREVNAYRSLLDTHVDGNPDHVSNADLWKSAWPLAEAHLKAERDAAIQRWHAVAGTNRAIDDLGHILTKAHMGGVDTLFVAKGQHRWGTFDADTQAMHVHEERQPDDEDLLDLAAARTLITGGSVHVVEPGLVPGNGVSAAILRF